MATDTQESSADIIAEMRDLAEHRDWNNHTSRSNRERISNLADRIEAAHRREVDKLNSAIQATVSRSDAEIDRLRREIAELRQAGDAAKLPDGRKMYDKYQIRHTDGTPLKGKRYFVLRLDSDDPLEAARVAAAMSAYKGETPQGNAAAMREALIEIRVICNRVGAGISPMSKRYKSQECQAVFQCFRKAVGALATPPRQCDIGTDNEQIRRWKEFCDHYEVDRSPESFARWGQGPYFDSISEGEEEPETNTQAKEGGDK